MRRHDAILFDLDETLYRERRYALSACRAVAESMQAPTGYPAARAFQQMALALRRGRRARLLQELCASAGWPEAVVPMLVDTMRAHDPSLRLPLASRRVLETLRGEYRIGVLTNGMPEVQRLKVKALGLAPLVDAVLYAAEHGSGCGKPEIACFLEAARELGVHPSRCVFVGDDPEKDVAGARAAGMTTILVARPGARPCPASIVPHAEVERIDEIPAALAAMTEEAGARCA